MTMAECQEEYLRVIGEVRREEVSNIRTYQLWQRTMLSIGNKIRVRVRVRVRVIGAEDHAQHR